MFPTVKEMLEQAKNGSVVDKKDHENMKADYELVLNAFLNRILDKVKRQMNWNAYHVDRKSMEVVLINYTDVTEWLDMNAKKTNIKPLTFFTGFWNSETLVHNYDSFKEAGIDTMLFDQAVEILKKSGYTLTDISDLEKSKKKACKIVWVE